MIKAKTIKIVSLILLLLISITYLPKYVSNLSNQPIYFYKDWITGQQWQVINNKNKIIERPVNVLMSNDEQKQYDDLNNEIEALTATMTRYQDAHDNYNNPRYTGGLSLDDLGINGGSSLSEWELTSILHEEAKKRLQHQQGLYLDAANKVSDLNEQIDALVYRQTQNALELRNVVNQIRFYSIFFLLLVIFGDKLLRLFKKTLSYILSD